MQLNENLLKNKQKEKLMKIYIIYFFRSFYFFFTREIDKRSKKKLLYNLQTKQFAAVFSLRSRSNSIMTFPNIQFS